MFQPLIRPLLQDEVVFKVRNEIADSGEEILQRALALIPGKRKEQYDHQGKEERR